VAFASLTPHRLLRSSLIPSRKRNDLTRQRRSLAGKRSTISCLIARDHAHELVFAKALETLGVNWGKVLPIPNFDATQYPEVKKLMIWACIENNTTSAWDGSGMARFFGVTLRANDGFEVETTEESDGRPPVMSRPERPEEFAPGLTAELLEMVAAVNR
jgi:Mn-containing catalase